MNESREAAPAQGLVWFLTLCAVWTLGAIAWAPVALLTPAGDSPQEAVERKAGTHHDQYEPAGRYYTSPWTGWCAAARR